MHHYIAPKWPAPANIRAYCTTRIGGKSQAPYTSFNLAYHAGDNPDLVAENRTKLEQDLQLPSPPFWLNQTHSTLAINTNDWHTDVKADACFSFNTHQVCIVMTADCLPILLCDKAGTMVAAIHAGWRGLANGIIQHTLEQIPIPNHQMIAWIGPSIRQQHFEVGDEVKEQFILQSPSYCDCFIPSQNGRWQADLQSIAQQILQSSGIEQVIDGKLCTYSDDQRFFSYRRDGETGRFASLIWLDS